MLCWMRQLCAGIWEAFGGNGWAEPSSIPRDSPDEEDLGSSALSIDLFLLHGHLTPVLSWVLFVTSSL